MKYYTVDAQENKRFIGSAGFHDLFGDRFFWAVDKSSVKSEVVDEKGVSCNLKDLIDEEA